MEGWRASLLLSILVSREGQERHREQWGERMSVVPRREIFKGRILGCFGARRASDSVPEKSRAFGEEKGVNSLRQRRQPRQGVLLGPGWVLGRGGVCSRIHLRNLRAPPSEGSRLCCPLGLVAGWGGHVKPAALACPWTWVGPGPCLGCPPPRGALGSITCSDGPKDAHAHCPPPRPAGERAGPQHLHAGSLPVHEGAEGG